MKYIFSLLLFLLFPPLVFGQPYQSVEISWATGGTIREWWEVERRTTPTGSYFTIGITPADTLSFVDGNVLEGQGYAYRVRTCDSSAQCEPYSNDIAAVFIPTGSCDTCPPCDPCPTCPPPPVCPSVCQPGYSCRKSPGGSGAASK